MRLVAHNGAPIWGGAEQATVRLLAGLARRGHEALLLCNDPVVRDRARAAGVEAALLPLGGDLMLQHAVRLARALRVEGADTLLLTTYRKLWLGALAGRLAGVRVVARVGLETDTPRNAKYRLVLKRWVDVVVLNAAAMRDAFETLPRGPAVEIIPTGIEPLRPGDGSGLRRALDIPADAFVAGTVARLAEQKRLDRLLGAAAALTPDIHVLVAGDGPERDALDALARELGLADRVHLPGHREDVASVLAALDVFVVSSDREGLSNAMLEALWAGVPVVSTPVSGARDALEPLADGRRPGRVVTFEAGAIADAVAELRADPGLQAEMGAAARERARERFGEERMLDAWETLLGGGA